MKTEESDGQELKYLTKKEIQLNPRLNTQENDELLSIQDKSVFNRNFQNSFNLMKRLGHGSFGEVYEVKDKINVDSFAVRKVPLKSKFGSFSRENNLEHFFR